jgi:hypothetical protein
MKEFSWIREKRLDKIRFLDRRNLIEETLRVEWVKWRPLHLSENVVQFLHHVDEIKLFSEEATPTQPSVDEIDFYYDLYTDLRDEDYKLCSHHIMPSNIKDLQRFLGSIPFVRP